MMSLINIERYDFTDIIEDADKKLILIIYEIIDGVKKVISNEDNVRIYRLNSSNELLLLGKSYSVYEEEVIVV